MDYTQINLHDPLSQVTYTLTISKSNAIKAERGKRKIADVQTVEEARKIAEGKQKRHDEKMVANGMVERFHRQMKAAIKCHETTDWTEVLPIVLMEIRAAWKEDLDATPAELVFGEPIRLPGQFLEE
ncbi:uncharacterized protein [Temnothorax nylanderi]|uniref:uncharacterized protein isoform X1 n=1 Tax=Temnothorax nylanderi TaxID=102681 RepID=UPI003A8BFE8D